MTFPEFQSWCSNLTKFLDSGWTYDPKHENNANIEWRQEIRNGEMGICLQQCKDKIEISGCWPVDENKHVYSPRFSQYGEAAIDIKVTPSRSFDNLAKDIQKRFVPAYLALFAKMLAQRESCNNYNNKIKENIEKLQSAMKQIKNRKNHHSVNEISFWAQNADGDIRVSGNSVRLTVDLPIDLCCQILGMFKPKSETEIED